MIDNKTVFNNFSIANYVTMSYFNVIVVRQEVYKKAENVTVGSMYNLSKGRKFWPSPIEWLHDAANKNQGALVNLKFLGQYSLLKAPKSRNLGLLWTMMVH